MVNYPGGSPQGTLLGNYLYIITTDELEDIREDVEIAEIPIEGVDPGETNEAEGPDSDELQYESLSTASTRSDDSFQYMINTSESETEDEPSTDGDELMSNHSGCERPKPGRAKKFVDDLIGIEVARRFNSMTNPRTGYSEIRVRKSELFFKSVKKNAEEIDMSVNDTKTQLLSVHPTHTKDYKMFIYQRADRQWR